ncbi:Phosphoserine transaminase [Metarhizium acridum]|uniref:Phosphoserine transaminase n=1 Tax=Metarhizium acridum TaxID=92637 RepID=UPI001C6B711B|nr:Phosphoserine transaminase [Metarhizium acridum]
MAEHSYRSESASEIINDAKADVAPYLEVPGDCDILFMKGGGSALKVQELRCRVDIEIKIDYLLTGSWSQKTAAEATTRLLGPEKVNIAADGRDVNNGKADEVPEETT